MNGQRLEGQVVWLRVHWSADHGTRLTGSLCPTEIIRKKKNTVHCPGPYGDVTKDNGFLLEDYSYDLVSNTSSSHILNCNITCRKIFQKVIFLIMIIEIFRGVCVRSKY